MNLRLVLAGGVYFCQSTYGCDSYSHRRWCHFVHNDLFSNDCSATLLLPAPCWIFICFSHFCCSMDWTQFWLPFGWIFWCKSRAITLWIWSLKFHLHKDIWCTWKDVKSSPNFQNDLFFLKLCLETWTNLRFSPTKSCYRQENQNIWCIAVNGNRMTFQIRENEKSRQRQQPPPPKKKKKQHLRQFNWNIGLFKTSSSVLLSLPRTHSGPVSKGNAVVQREGMPRIGSGSTNSLCPSLSTTFNVPHHNFCPSFHI